MALVKTSLSLTQFCLLLHCLISTANANLPPTFAEIPNTSPQKQYDMDKEQFPENTEIGVVIYTLIATDPDGDCVSFSIKAGEGDDYFKLEDGGNCTHVGVQLKQNLDYEVNTRHDITWLLDDGTNAPVETDITVYVTDVNDNAPKFSIMTPSNVDVSEHEDIGTIILKVTVTDEDTGANGMGSLTMIEEKNWNGTFHLEDHGDWTGDVSLTAALDYELKTEYALLLIATDEGSIPGPLSTSMNVTVLVIDMQDMPPQWIGEPYWCTVYDTMAVNSTIIVVTARDGDRDTPNEIFYFISNSTDNVIIDDYFDINMHSGEIYIKKALNASLYGEWNLTVMAVEVDSEQTWDLKTSETNVEIMITPGPTPTTIVIDLTDTYLATLVTVLIFGVAAVFIMAICIYNGENNSKRIWPSEDPEPKDKKEEKDPSDTKQPDYWTQIATAESQA